MTGKIIKSESEWMRTLTPEQFRVTRLHATERPVGTVAMADGPASRPVAKFSSKISRIQ